MSVNSLDLDKWINEPPSESSDEDSETFTLFPLQEKEKGKSANHDNNHAIEPTEEELKMVCHPHPLTPFIINDF